MDKLIKKEKIVIDGFETFETIVEIFTTNTGFRVTEKDAQETTEYFVDYLSETEIQFYKITKRNGRLINDSLVLNEIGLLIEDIKKALEEEWNKQCGEKQ